MAQTGFTPISIYYSSTASATPTAGNLVAGELAINTADGKLFYKDSAGVVQVIGTKGGVGSSTTTQVLYNSSGLVVGSANMTFNGTTFTLANDASISGLTVGKGAGSVSSNTVLGLGALGSNTTGSSNVVMGQQALSNNTTGANNVVQGFQSFATNTTGTNNVSTGYQAGFSNTTGAANVAIGSGALQLNTTASNNTAVGYQAGYSNTTGSPNTFIGYQAGYSNQTGLANTAVGYLALRATTVNSNTAMGYLSLTATTTGASNCGFGQDTLGSNTTGSNNTAVGNSSLFANTTGSSNTAYGNSALQNNTTAPYNTAVGWQAGYSNTTGRVDAFGSQVLYTNTTGYGNLGIGGSYVDSVRAALYGNTTGFLNIAVGQGALSYNTTGYKNAAVGYGSLYNCSTGAGNVAIGDRALEGLSLFNVTTENDRVQVGCINTSNAYVRVAWTVTSDARDKTNITPITHGLDFVKQLNPVSYNFKKSREDDTPHGNKRYGFLAQEILALEGQDNVIIDNEDKEHLKYQGEALVPVLVKAIQELKAEVDSLKQQLGK
jgi:hypothetical protein